MRMRTTTWHSSRQYQVGCHFDKFQQERVSWFVVFLRLVWDSGGDTGSSSSIFPSLLSDMCSATHTVYACWWPGQDMG